MRGDCLISELEIIGKGNTATVYRMEDAKVLKLFPGSSLVTLFVMGISSRATFSSQTDVRS